ncbi:MAG: hypothetical protein WC898_01845 [Candidatus Paceibacterota bacterium]|jgi:hypothetical protein
MEKMNFNEKRIKEAVRNIPRIAKNESWVFTLDREEGNFFYSPQKISDNTEFYQVTDEYALYLDKEYKPRGIVIEGYNANFIKHHKDIRKVSEKLFQGKENIKIIDPKEAKNKEIISVFKALLENVLED